MILRKIQIKSFEQMQNAASTLIHINQNVYELTNWC